MLFDMKLAVVLRTDLANWQRANVTAFLVSGIAGTVPSVVGEPYVDGSGNRYLPMFRQPVLVFEADRLEAVLDQPVHRLPDTRDDAHGSPGEVTREQRSCHNEYVSVTNS